MMILRGTIPIGYGDPDPNLLDRSTALALRYSVGRSAVDLYRSLVHVQEYTARALRIFDDYDMLLAPCVARPSVPHQWVTDSDDPMEIFARAANFAPFAAIANLGGLCAVSLPVHRNVQG